MVDLASARYGGEVIWCNDEFFAPASNLISPAAPVWREGEFTDHGKWMDGWETRRRREPGHDSCIIRLGLPGIVDAVTVDTSYFTGNYPESFSLDACGADSNRLGGAEWVELIPPTPLEGNTTATFDVRDDHRATHVRLNIYPDGGIARLRVEGRPVPDRDRVCPEEGLVDLADASLGGCCIDCSDAHFASPDNLLSPTEPEGMWDGWETARRRGPGNDWVVVDLGLPGTIDLVDVDTRFFKGNAPGSVQIETWGPDGKWRPACDPVAVAAHEINRIELAAPVEAERIRFNIFPDGGVARLRVWGRPRAESLAAVRMLYVNSLFDQEARSFFRTACAADRWVETMVAGRPYTSAAHLYATADEAFRAMEADDWLEAFAAHPRIGERRGHQNAAGEAMSSREQAGVGDAVRHELAELNRRYEEKFGFTYIVRAAGRTGEEMTELARARLANDPKEEIEVAAGQQREITMLRLRRMLCQPEEDG